MLVPEIWCRMTPAEREPAALITEGHLERCADFEFNGKKVLASRLGWRITARFVQTFCGRVLGNPSAVFDEEFLQPEKQDLEVFADGVVEYPSQSAAMTAPTPSAMPPLMSRQRGRRGGSTGTGRGGC